MARLRKFKTRSCICIVLEGRKIQFVSEVKKASRLNFSRVVVILES